MPTGDPLVSIRCTVYNHEPFLRQCLDGFVMQKTTFPFEAIVHDDASTDGSAAIIREYAEKYPDIIKPIYETENQYSKHDGSIGRIMDAAMHPNSKYIATCEGDDYWTDPNKLQLQVDFLETHPDYFLSSHNFSVYYQETKTIKHNKSWLDSIESFDVFHDHVYYSLSNESYFDIWFLSTLSIVKRRQQYVEKELVRMYPVYYDYIDFYYLTKKGKCAAFKEEMATYRVHKKGVYSGSNIVVWNETYLENCYVLLKLENESRVIPCLDSMMVQLFIQLIKEKKFERAIYVFVRHSRNVPIKHSLICLKNITKIKLKELIGKVMEFLGLRAKS